MILPDELLHACETSSPHTTRWIALCPRRPTDRQARRFQWPLDPHRKLGEGDFRRWVKQCVRFNGCPVRIQWRIKATRPGSSIGELLAEGTVWDDEETFDEYDEIPTIAEAFLPRNGDLLMEGPAPTSAVERFFTLAIEKPDSLSNCFVAVADFMKSFTTPDDVAMEKVAERAADRAGIKAARAVETTIERIMREAGVLDDDDDQDVIDVEQDVIDVIDVVEVDEEIDNAQHSQIAEEIDARQGQVGLGRCGWLETETETEAETEVTALHHLYTAEGADDEEQHVHHTAEVSDGS